VTLLHGKAVVVTCSYFYSILYPSFESKGGREFGRMLLNNSRLLRLDISGNSLRGEGAMAFFKGLKVGYIFSANFNYYQQ